MTDRCRVVVVPATPLLVPRYAALRDPVPDLRAACRAAVSWLVGEHPGPVPVLCAETSTLDGGRVTPRGLVVAEQLLAESGHRGGVEHLAMTGEPPRLAGRALLVVADGSARRGEQAPGHLDPRAFDHDAAIGEALREGDLEALRGIDPDLAAAVLSEGGPVLRRLADLVDRVERAELCFDDDPLGVQYWVARWVCRPAGTALS